MKSLSETRPWGSFVRFFTGDNFETVKLLYVHTGEELSLQYHHKREEFWRIISGNPKITIGEDVRTASPGDEFVIPVETKHRISAIENDVVILEISTGDFDEADIIRLEDKYNRIM